MSTQQDIYAAGSKNRPHMLNKENYVPWSSRLLRFAKSRPNGKLIYNYIMNGPYVRRMIPEPGNKNHEVPVPETFHKQTDDELTEAEIKQMEADDQATQTILLGLPEDIYAAVDSCKTAQEIWFTSIDGESIESYYHRFLKLMNDFKRNKHFPEKIAKCKESEWVEYSTECWESGCSECSLESESSESRAEGNAIRNNGNQIRCYNCRGLWHLARNCTTQLLIAQKKKAGIQLQAEEFDLIVAAANLDEIEEVNSNYILMANLQQASTSGTQTDKAPVYDSDGSADVHHYNNCYNNDIFNMFTQEEQYTELLEPIPKLHHVQHNDSNVIFKVSSVEQDVGTVDQYPKTVEETRAYFESLYNNLAIKVEKDEIFSIVNQVDARLQNFKIQLLKEAAKFVRDFKSLAKETDESLAKHKTLELEIERLLRAVIEWLQTQLGDQKGKSEDTPCVSNALDPLSQILENENVELEFQVRNYEKENTHLKTTYKNLFDSISMTQAQTKIIIDSLQDKLHGTIYENAKLRTQLFDKVSEQKDTTKGTSVNTQFYKQLILGKPPSSSGSKLYAVTPFLKSKGLPKIDETHALSKPITSNSPSRKEKYVPNKVRASIRTNLITVSQPYVITKKDVNSDSNGLSSTGVHNPAKTRRLQPRSNTKNDKVPSTSKSSCSKNKEVKVEEHPRNLLLSKNKKHMSSECNNVKLVIQNDKSEVVCAMCKQCLITANHDVCVLNYVNDMNSHGKKQKTNVSNTKNQKKQKSKVMKPKKVGSNERLASRKPSKPRSCHRWSPTKRLFDLKGKIIASSESESQTDYSNGDNACTSNPPEPTIKRFPNSTSFLASLSKFIYGASTRVVPSI
nr:hypothetical protein [Tanacetum cinerariifolium]